MSGRIVLAGGGGFLGRSLSARLVAAGREVVVLTREPAGRAGPGLRTVVWDGRTAGPWARELDGAAALVNFAGRSINCVHDEPNRREILDSRVRAVEALGAAWAQAARPPGAWVQCSALGYYGDAGDRWCDEDAPAGTSFLAEVCARWEEAFARAAPTAARRVVFRLGVVLDAREGALPPLVAIARWFLGGAAGSGRQFLSWVHRADAVAAFARAIDDPAWSGTYNLCAPAPVTNAEFMRTLRGALGRPWSPPAPAFAVRLVAKHVLRTAPELALEGQRGRPRRLHDAGFSFAFSALNPALRDLLGGAR